jgi:LPS-assembly protein
VLPTVSLDSGLVFERDARYFGRAFTQTLEPRLKYVYTPYRDQNGLPNYDSGLYDFNFATIWADNIFAGNDRIVDNNLITAGLTSRLLDPQTGAEALRLSVAQRYRFTRSRWCCPAARRRQAACRTSCWARASPGTRTGPSTRWCSTTARPTVHAHHGAGALFAGPFRTVSAAYRLQRDLANESVDVGWQWPLGGGGGRGELGTTRRAAAAAAAGAGTASGA